MVSQIIFKAFLQKALILESGLNTTGITFDTPLSLLFLLPPLEGRSDRLTQLLSRLVLLWFPGAEFMQNQEMLHEEVKPLPCPVSTVSSGRAWPSRDGVGPFCSVFSDSHLRRPAHPFLSRKLLFFICGVALEIFIILRIGKDWIVVTGLDSQVHQVAFCPLIYYKD